MAAAPDPVVLHSLLATHPATRALKTGAVSSPLVRFDFHEVKVANTQFKAMVREARYDFGELAVVTALQAIAHGKPYVLLPATIVGRSQHHTIFYNADRGALAPTGLNGCRIGVRAYTQTTGAWVRGFLADDYGLDIGRVHWVTFEDPHVAEYQDPPIVTRAPEGTTLKQMLLDGEIDAAILGDAAEEGPLRHLLPDHEAAGRRWAETHGGVPINHMAVVRRSVVDDRPDVVRELYRLLRESRDVSGVVTGPLDPLRFGVAAVRESLSQIVRDAVRQQLLSTPVTVDALLADAVRVLGEDAR